MKVWTQQISKKNFIEVKWGSANGVLIMCQAQEVSPWQVHNREQDWSGSCLLGLCSLEWERLRILPGSFMKTETPLPSRWPLSLQAHLSPLSTSFTALKSFLLTSSLIHAIASLGTFFTTTIPCSDNSPLFLLQVKCRFLQDSFPIHCSLVSTMTLEVPWT